MYKMNNSFKNKNKNHSFTIMLFQGSPYGFHGKEKVRFGIMFTRLFLTVLKVNAELRHQVPKMITSIINAP